MKIWKHPNSPRLVERAKNKEFGTKKLLPEKMESVLLPMNEVVKTNGSINAT